MSGENVKPFDDFRLAYNFNKSNANSLTRDLVLALVAAQVPVPSLEILGAVPSFDEYFEIRCREWMLTYKTSPPR